jgi:uncharacterized protein
MLASMTPHLIRNGLGARWACVARLVLAVLFLSGVFPLGAAMAAPSTTAPGGGGASALEQAVALYEQGHWAAAQAAFERLSAAGVPAADHNLGVMHLRKELPQPSVDQGLRLLARAAERGFVTAMVMLAHLHERGDVTGQKDLAQAYRWHRKAAEAGHMESQVETATAHYLGRGARKDMTEAAHWYREAAKQGEGGAQYLLASMYEHGLGVDKDLRLARYWYARCAQGGDIAAPGKVREMDAKLAAGPAEP